MIMLVAGLAACLALALVAVLYLGISLPRRVTRLVLEERRAADLARAEKAALKQATALDVQELVYALRGYHDEIAQRAAIAREITTEAAAEEVTRTTGALRELVRWLLELIGEDAVQTCRLPPGQAPVSGPAPTFHAPPVAPPCSAPVLQSNPACVAAGLARPKATPSGPIRSTPRSGDGLPRSTMRGLAPHGPDPGDSGERIGSTLASVNAPLAVPIPGNRPDTAARPTTPGPRTSAQTLVSMVAVSAPSARPALTVAIEHRGGDAHERGAT